MRRWALLVVGVMGGACEEPLNLTTTPVMLIRDDVWSGSELRLVSRAFAPATTPAPPVSLDDDPLDAQRFDDTTFVVSLPDRPGSHTIRVAARGAIPFQGTVQLRGFVNSETGPVLTGRTEPTAERAEVFGDGPDGLRQWNVRTGLVTDFPDTMHLSALANGVGPGLVNGHVALYSRVGGATPQFRWLLWRITGPKATVIDTIPAEVISDRFIAVLAFGRYAQPGAHHFQVKACVASTCSSELFRGESGFDIVRSRRGDRAALVAYVVSDSGAPVVDIATGRPAYFVPPFQSVGGAAFTDEGDTLFLAGQDHFASTGGPSLLAAVRASDGMTLVTRPLGFWPCAVALESTHSWVYVAGLRNEGSGVFTSVFEVFDRRTLASLTTLRGGGDVPFGLNLCRILPNPAEHRVYVIETAEGPFDARIHATLARFATPP